MHMFVLRSALHFLFSFTAILFFPNNIYYEIFYFYFFRNSLKNI